MTALETKMLKDIPSRIDTNKTLGMIKSGKVGAVHLEAIKSLTSFNDGKNI